MGCPLSIQLLSVRASSFMIWGDCDRLAAARCQGEPDAVGGFDDAGGADEVVRVVCYVGRIAVDGGFIPAGRQKIQAEGSIVGGAAIDGADPPIVLIPTRDDRPPARDGKRDAGLVPGCGDTPYKFEAGGAFVFGGVIADHGQVAL